MARNPAESHAQPSTPAVSIGMPVYNGERHLRTALDSILAQTLRNFELLIADNASSDGTAEICQEYARRDPRVRYFRHPTNIGAPRNYTYLVGPARGRYFKWASGNDICEPSMLETCVRVLDGDPSAVLCYGATRLIDDADVAIEHYEKDLALLEPRASERYRTLRQKLALNNAQNGVIRLDALRHTRLIGTYAGSDLTMMATLSLLGKFVLLPEVLFNRRMSEGAFSGRMSKTMLGEFLDPTSGSGARLDALRSHFDHLLSIFGAPIGWRERLPALATALRHVIWNRHVVARELLAWLGLRGRSTHNPH